MSAVDDHTVKFTLSKAFAPFLSTVPAIMVLNSKVVEANLGNDDGQTYLATHVAGAGAYTLTSWDRGSQMTIVRNPDYYKGFRCRTDRRGALDHHQRRSHRALAGRVGRVDHVLAVSVAGDLQGSRSHGRFKIVAEDTPTAFYLKLNSKVAPTDDLHIRKAIALATDYATIRDVIVPGGELNGPLPKNFADFYASDLPAPQYDIEAARRRSPSPSTPGRRYRSPSATSPAPSSRKKSAC